jgi:predicted unusual protein kinase regulating ubiquinone biosynthesis (AarF/ABC1/UbiB family)
MLLTPGNARRMAESLSRMRGAAMKLGQLISLEGGSMLPDEFAEILAILRDSAHTMSSSQLHALLGREYGQGWRRRFEGFDEAPIAAASIGQVHRVRTADSRDLALKLQFPGIARSVSSDVDNMASLLKAARLVPPGFDLDPLVRTVKRQLLLETDYLHEAESLRRFKTMLADDPGLYVPAPHADLTTKRILAMDYVDGLPLSAIDTVSPSQRERDRLGESIQRLVMRELFELRCMQSDPNFANFFYQPKDRVIALLDFGSTVEIEPELTRRYRCMLTAGRDGDLLTVETLVVEFGWVEADERPDRIEGLAALIGLACEPLRARGRYDFGRSDLPSRIREAGLDLAFGRGLLRPPPPELVFIHRKLAGSFLICARLGARVDSAAVARSYLGA